MHHAHQLGGSKPAGKPVGRVETRGQPAARGSKPAAQPIWATPKIMKSTRRGMLADILIPVQRPSSTHAPLYAHSNQKQVREAGFVRARSLALSGPAARTHALNPLHALKALSSDPKLLRGDAGCLPVAGCQRGAERGSGGARGASGVPAGFRRGAGFQRGSGGVPAGRAVPAGRFVPAGGQPELTTLAQQRSRRPPRAAQAEDRMRARPFAAVQCAFAAVRSTLLPAFACAGGVPAGCDRKCMAQGSGHGSQPGSPAARQPSILKAQQPGEGCAALGAAVRWGRALEVISHTLISLPPPRALSRPAGQAKLFDHAQVGGERLNCPVGHVCMVSALVGESQMDIGLAADGQRLGWGV
jgi:hypothetical protein